MAIFFILLHLPLLLLHLLNPSTATINNAATAALRLDYYSKTCPQLEQVVSDTIINKQISSPTTAAGTLRLFFHDCFVGGCDASVLISTPSFHTSPPSERDSDINLSLPGDAFDAVVRAKTKLDLLCPPATVSCSDILALAARDLLTMLGGPYYPVRLGRKDSLSSSASAVATNIPLPNRTLSDNIRIFAAKGFTVREMVALSGAHTVGFSHCKEFASRIYNYNNRGWNSFDPSMNPRFAAGLQKACGDYMKDPTIAAFNDIMTPGKFDNVYFQNLERGLGLLKSDQDLASDPRTAGIVREYARDQDLFFKEFAVAMEKMSLVGVKTGRDGDVRRRCDAFNNFHV